MHNGFSYYLARSLLATSQGSHKPLTITLNNSQSSRLPCSQSPVKSRTTTLASTVPISNSVERVLLFGGHTVWLLGSAVAVCQALLGLVLRGRCTHTEACRLTVSDDPYYIIGGADVPVPAWVMLASLAEVLPADGRGTQVRVPSGPRLTEHQRLGQLEGNTMSQRGSALSTVCLAYS